MTGEPLLLGVRAAAGILGTGRDATYQLVHEHRIRSVRVGRRLLIPRAELEAFVEREGGGAMVIPPSDQDEGGATD
jgi:excisionase family DNA binding protein